MDDITKLLTPGLLSEPYPFYAELQARTPVFKVEPLGFWLVSRYDDVQYVLKTPERFSSTRTTDLRRAIGDERLYRSAEILARCSLNGSDPPVHTRLRRLISAAFTPKAIARLEARISALSRELVDDILRRDAFDLMEDMAIPLPIIVLSELLGVDPARRAEFKRWSNDFLVGTRFNEKPEDAEIARVVESRQACFDHFRALIDARRREPKEDLISDLVRAEEADEMLTSEEVLATAVLVMLAGNETTTNLIGNAMTTLLDHPEDLRRLRADPSLIPGFLEEVLRYRSPVTMLTRTTTEEVTIRGVTIPKGEFIGLLLDAANRDPEHFADPARFDITRPAQAHFTFGHGIHFCLGASLSRLEGKIAFEEMLRRLPPFSRAPGPFDWKPSFNLRGLTTLPLRFDRGPAGSLASPERP